MKTKKDNLGSDYVTIYYSLILDSDGFLLTTFGPFLKEIKAMVRMCPQRITKFNMYYTGILDF